MEDTSELILRHQDEVPSGALLVNPPDDGLLAKLPPGRAVSLHYGRHQQLSQNEGWESQFGLTTPSPSDFAIIWMPKARREFDLLVAWTLSQLNPGGRLWLVGEKKGGTDSSGKALRTRLGRGTKRDSARHCQLWVYSIENTAQDFSIDQWVDHRSAHVPLGNNSRELFLADLPGVFSQGRLDDGTALLLGSFKEQPKSPVLDFACGGGVIGAVLLAHWCSLDMKFVDVQWQALLATQHTLRANGLEGEVIPGNGLEGISGQFGTIVTNPPFHSGLKKDLEIVQQFIGKAKTHLLPGGVLWLVANAFLPYMELLQKQFNTVEIVADDRRFKVYCASSRKGR